MSTPTPAPEAEAKASREDSGAAPDPAHTGRALFGGVTRREMEDYVDQRLAAARDPPSREDPALVPRSRISDAAVDRFVTTLLADPGVNLRYVPDAVEGAVYRNLLTVLLHAVARTSDTAGIELLGHRIRLVIEPIEPAPTDVEK
jgi:hypothetical protein